MLDKKYVFGYINYKQSYIYTLNLKKRNLAILKIVNSLII